MRLICVATLASIYSMTNGFTPVPFQNHMGPLFSTIQEVRIASDEDTKKKDELDWLTEQFHLVKPLDLVTDLKPVNRVTYMGSDWFGVALSQEPMRLKKGLQVDESSPSSLDKTSCSGILPAMPPPAPSMTSLTNQHLEPENYEPLTDNAFLPRENVEWYSETSPAFLVTESVAHHNRLQQGGNDWFSQALIEC